MYQELLHYGITCFVDLTTRYERQHLSFVYSHPHRMSFPIRDNSIPYNTDAFRRFIIRLADMIHHHKGKIYIHCKGGHNRSGLLISSLLCFMENMEPMKAMAITADLHTARVYMKEKYKNTPCPDNLKQRQFVIDLFHPILISESMFTDRIVYNVMDFILTTEVRPILSAQSPFLIPILLEFRQKLYFREAENNKKKYMYSSRKHADDQKHHMGSGHIPRFLERPHYYSPKMEHE